MKALASLDRIWSCYLGNAALSDTQIDTEVLKYFVELLKLKSKCPLKIQVSEYKISNKFEVPALFIIL